MHEIGCSSTSTAQLREAAALVRPGAPQCVVVENEHSLVKRDVEAEVLPECTRQGLAIPPRFPLAGTG